MQRVTILRNGKGALTMRNRSQDWWPVIRDILVNEWGFDGQYLKPTTPLFTGTVAAWMDWVELLQTIADQADIEWLPMVAPESLTCGQDLVHLLEHV